MIEIYVDEGVHLDKAIKRFRKKCEKFGLFDEMKRREYFEKPSTIRRRETVNRNRKKKFENENDQDYE